jgi:glycine/D-amino acid oxidase-like deaminating enzyme
VVVRAAGGARLQARALVLAAGGWLGGLVPELEPLLQVRVPLEGKQTENYEL